VHRTSPPLTPPAQIWDIAKKRIARIYDGHTQDIYSLQYSRDGRFIVSGSGDGTARVWDMTVEPGMPSALTRVLSIDEPDVDGGVTSVAISPDGRLVAAGSLDTAVRIWDVGTGALLHKLLGHKNSVYSVIFNPDGSGLISSSLDKTLKYWDVRTLARREPGRKDKDEKIPCLMNFTGHKVRPRSSARTRMPLTRRPAGLRPLRRRLEQRQVGRLRLQGPRRPVLGRAHGSAAVHAPGPQELGCARARCCPCVCARGADGGCVRDSHLDRPQPAGIHPRERERRLRRAHLYVPSRLVPSRRASALLTRRPRPRRVVLRAAPVRSPAAPGHVAGLYLCRCAACVSVYCRLYIGCACGVMSGWNSTAREALVALNFGMLSLRIFQCRIGQRLCSRLCSRTCC
jgi:hypothetical protein